MMHNNPRQLEPGLELQEYLDYVFQPRLGLSLISTTEIEQHHDAHYRSAMISLITTLNILRCMQWDEENNVNQRTIQTAPDSPLWQRAITPPQRLRQ